MSYPKRQLNKTVAAIALCAFAVTLMPTRATRATAFNPNYLISDSEMRNAYSMDFQQIYDFLEQKGGLNRQFDVDAVDGLLKGTAQLIDDAAKRYRINPKYVLVLLQKESGIVETAVPTKKQLDWAAGYALCDGCLKSNPLAQKYMGFAKQIDAGAGWMDWYMTNSPMLTYLKQPGQTFTVSSVTVTPANLATAGMYNYTPHIAGNKLFYNIWQRWWGSGAGSISFPDGTLIMNEASGAYALIQGGKFRPILSRSVLETRFGNRAPVVLDNLSFRSLEETNPGRPLSFPDLSLVRDENGATYLLIGDQRRQIESDEVFRQIGFNPEEVETVTLADIEDYVLGSPITLNEAYPLGQLVQDKTTGGVWYVEAGERHAIWDRAILDARFGGRPLIQAAPEDIERYRLGSPATLPDGTLVKTPDDPTVFVISDGLRRRIPSEDVFLGYGYRWGSVIICGAKALTLHPLGEPLLLINEDTVTAALATKE